MSEPRHALVLSVFDAFRGAIEARESASAEALATHAGWRGRGAGIGRFYRRAARLGQVPQPTDAVSVHQDRAVVSFADGEGTDRYACFVLDDDQWKLDALVAHPVRSALHLSGALEPLARLDHLPASERAAAWARHVVGTGASWRPEIWPTEPAGVAAVETLQGLLGESGVRVDRTGAWDIPTVQRSVAGLRVSRRRSEAVDEMWVVLQWDASEGRLVLHHIEWTDGVDGALDGVPLQWDGAELGTSLPEPSTPEDGVSGYTPRELMGAFDAARRAFVQAGGASVDPAHLDALRRIFASRVHSGKGSGGRSPALDMTGAVRDYLAQQGDDEETVVNRDFVANHASGVLNAMIGAFTKALIPESVETGDADKRVTVDVADLVGSLLPGQDDSAE